jgi:hypothetical protein
MKIHFVKEYGVQSDFWVDLDSLSLSYDRVYLQLFKYFLYSLHIRQ